MTTTTADQVSTRRRSVVSSPVGLLELEEYDGALTGLRFADGDDVGVAAGADAWRADASAGVLLEAAEQLDAYFARKLERFDLPIALEGTSFQRQVWAVLQQIPYGLTVSYGAVASAVGRPGAARAVGRANHDNPIAIVVPCHRVVGRNGALTGYGGGLGRKQLLLDLERGWGQT
jgi:methylated-DNA-[protein]-cysteine S-methyltransferase